MIIDPQRDPLCQHEFPDTRRCIGHQNDGQPDALIDDAGVPALAGDAR